MAKTGENYVYDYENGNEIERSRAIERDDREWDRSKDNDTNPTGDEDIHDREGDRDVSIAVMTPVALSANPGQATQALHSAMW